jgi:Beta-propeller repeat
MKYLRAALLACALSLVLMALTAAQSGIRPTLSYSTYLSGNDRTMILASTADLNGFQYATGITTAADFPTTSGAYRTTPSKVNSCSVKDTCSYQTMFITKLNRNGTGLAYSTFIGNARPVAITVDSAGNAYALAQQLGTDVPITAAAWRRTCAANCFLLVKLNSSGSAVVYSTFLQGTTCEESFSGVAVDTAQQAHVVGFGTPGCYTTANAFKRKVLSGRNAIVMKLNSSGSAVIYSTYVGGYNYGASDTGTAIAVDSKNAIVVGYTQSPDFPTSESAFQRTRQGQFADAFVAKLSSDGTTLLASSLLGGSSSDGAYGVAADRFNNVYVVGKTASTDFPITPNAPQPTADTGVCGPSNDQSPCGDAFISKLPADFSYPIYSTYLGGPNGEESEFIYVSVDGVGHAFVTGTSTSSQVPLAKPTGPSGLTWLTELSTGGGSFLFSTRYGNGPNGSTVPKGIGVDQASNAFIGGTVLGSGLQTTNAYQTSNRSADGFAGFAAKWEITPCTLNTANRTVTICTPQPNMMVATHMLLAAGAADDANVSAMRAYVDGVAKFSIAASHFNTYLDLPAGSHRITVKAWDSAGSFSNTVFVTVQ